MKKNQSFWLGKGTRRCEYCDAVSRMRLNQKYCSAACRQADYRYRKMEHNAQDRTEDTAISL